MLNKIASWCAGEEWMNNIVICRAVCASNPSFPSHLAWLSVGLLTNYIPDHSCLIFHGFTNKLHLRTPLVALCQLVISLLRISFRVLSMIQSGGVVGIAIGYGLDGPGIESHWGARFSALVQTGPGAHPASCTVGAGSFPGVQSSQGMMLTPHPLLVPWSRKGRAIPLLPLWVVRPVQSLSACTRVTFTFFFFIRTMTQCHHNHWLVLPVIITYVVYVGVDTSLSTWSLN